jgi:glycosyltransferase involved in cell wall biosynthesis
LPSSTKGGHRPIDKYQIIPIALMTDSDLNQASYIKKAQIQELLKRRAFSDAEKLLEEYAVLYPNDPDTFCLKGMLTTGVGNPIDAENIIQKGLKIESNNVNLLYQMGFLYEKKGQYNRALNYYDHALDCSAGKIAGRIKDQIDQLEVRHKNQINFNRKKIAFFVRRQMDHFLDDIIYYLSEDFETRKIVVSKYGQVDTGMAWADICWFEWCDNLVLYGSKIDLAQEKKIVCRLHRREVFESFITAVVWENVDRLIVVADHLKKLMALQAPQIENRVQVTTIHNGVDVNRYGFKQKSKGYHLAWICNIDKRKNPSLLLQIIKKLVDLDSRYKLFVAGKFVDPLVEGYWNYQIREMNLVDNIVFDGWQGNVERWLEDKDYLISTSIHESFGYNIAEAMAMGIKPVVHDFLYAPEIWNRRYLFNTVDQAVAMIISPEYNSAAYRRYIVDNFSLQQQISRIEDVLNSI